MAANMLLQQYLPNIVKQQDSRCVRPTFLLVCQISSSYQAFTKLLPKAITSGYYFRVLPSCCCLQTKAFISEAHVFNDAGLSFDVWPPKTGTHVHEPSSCENYAEDYLDSRNDADDRGSPDSLGVESCSVDGISATNNCLAGSAHDSVSNGSSTCSVSGASTMEVSRGYLLAVKLWHEAVARFAAASGGEAHLQK